MLSRRCYLLGLLSALLALMVQLSAGASVPRLDPVAQLVGAETLCHEMHDSGGAPFTYNRLCGIGSAGFPVSDDNTLPATYGTT